MLQQHIRKLPETVHIDRPELEKSTEVLPRLNRRDLMLEIKCRRQAQKVVQTAGDILWYTGLWLDKLVFDKGVVQR